MNDERDRHDEPRFVIVRNCTRSMPDKPWYVYDRARRKVALLNDPNADDRGHFSLCACGCRDRMPLAFFVTKVQAVHWVAEAHAMNLTHDGPCDYQVQCDRCFAASERQYNEWFARAGYKRIMYYLVIDRMREQAHAEALAEDAERCAGYDKTIESANGGPDADAGNAC